MHSVQKEQHELRPRWKKTSWDVPHSPPRLALAPNLSDAYVLSQSPKLVEDVTHTSPSEVENILGRAQVAQRQGVNTGVVKAFPIAQNDEVEEPVSPHQNAVSELQVDCFSEEDTIVVNRSSIFSEEDTIVVNTLDVAEKIQDFADGRRSLASSDTESDTIVLKPSYALPPSRTKRASKKPSTCKKIAKAGFSRRAETHSATSRMQRAR